MNQEGKRHLDGRQETRKTEVEVMHRSYARELPARERSSEKGLPQEVSQVLSQFSPQVTAELDAFAERPLADYLRAVSQPKTGLSPHSIAARKAILSALESEMMGAGIARSGMNCEDLADALWQAPVIFTGPHLQLLTERYTMAGYLTAFAFAVANSLPAVWMLPCATLRMQVERRRGPGWVNVGDRQYNVFGLSTEQLKRRRVAAEGAPLQFAFTASEGSPEQPPLLSLVDDLSSNLGAELFHQANHRMLQQHCSPNAPVIAAFDERLAAAVVAQHLLDPNSIVYRVLLDPVLQNTYQHAVAAQSMTLDPRELRYPTDHFWIADSNGRLASVNQQDALLKPRSTKSSARPIPIDATALRLALSKGQLIPNLWLSYFVLGFLPGVRLAGGVRQLFYMSAYHKTWRALLDPHDNRDAALLDATKDGPDHIWALTAAEAPAKFIERLIEEDPSLRFDDVAELMLEQTLADTSLSFDAIVSHEYFD